MLLYPENYLKGESLSNHLVEVSNARRALDQNLNDLRLCLFCLIVSSYSCFIVYLMFFKCILLYRWCNLIQAICLCCISPIFRFVLYICFLLFFYDGNKLELELELEKLQPVNDDNTAKISKNLPN